jgi:hypothetical protein
MERPMAKRLTKSGETVQAIAEDARKMIWVIGGGPVTPGITDERLAENAQRRLKWPFSRVLNMYRQRSRIIHAAEWLQLNEEAAQLAQQLKTLRGLQHENDRLAGRAARRVIAALAGEAADDSGDLDDQEVERPAEQGGARPDLLKRKRYWAG